MAKRAQKESPRNKLNLVSNFQICLNDTSANLTSMQGSAVSFIRTATVLRGYFRVDFLEKA